MTKLKRHLPVLPVLALASGCLLVGAGGGAVAGRGITGADIVDGTVGSVDIRDGTIKKVDLSVALLDSLQGKQGPSGPTGPAGPAGPAGPQGSSGPAGTARAWATVQGDGTITRQSGNVTISHVAGSGTYCISVTGVVTTATSAVASIDYSYTPPSSSVVPLAYVRSINSSCAGNIGVQTGKMTLTGTPAWTLADETFSIVVP